VCVKKHKWHWQPETENHEGVDWDMTECSNSVP